MKVYSIKEASQILGVSKSYVYYLIHTHRIEAEKIGNQYTISEEGIEHYKNDGGE